MPIGNTPPNEAQARELAPLLDQPEKLQRAWERARLRRSGLGRGERDHVYLGEGRTSPNATSCREQPLTFQPHGGTVQG